MLLLRKLSKTQENSDTQKEIRRIIHDMKETCTQEIDTIKKNQTEILELKSLLKEIQNAFKNFNNRLDQAGEKIQNLKTGLLKLPSQILPNFQRKLTSLPKLFQKLKRKEFSLTYYLRPALS